MLVTIKIALLFLSDVLKMDMIKYTLKCQWFYKEYLIILTILRKGR